MPSFAAAIASGIFLALSFPRYGHPIVAFVALAPLLVALSGWTGRPGEIPGVSTWKGFRLGLVTGVIHFAGTVYWTGATVQTFGGLLVAGRRRWSPDCSRSYLGSFLAVTARNRFDLRFGDSGRRACWLAPAAWVTIEYARGNYLFGGFPWIPLGNTMVTLLPIAQLASVVGVYGLSIFVGLVNVGFAAPRSPRAGRGAVAAVSTLALITAASVWGGQRMAANTLVTGGTPIKVGLIQGNIAQVDKWNPARAGMIVDRYLQLTQQAVDAGAEFVLWPESSTPFYFDEDPGANVVRTMVQRTGKPLLLGSDEIERDGADDPVV